MSSNDAASKIGQDVVVLNADAEREFEPAFVSLTAKRAIRASMHKNG